MSHSEIDADQEQAIRELAYRLWENDGRPDGYATVYWERARDQLADQATAPAPGSPQLHENAAEVATPKGTPTSDRHSAETVTQPGATATGSRVGEFAR